MQIRIHAYENNVSVLGPGKRFVLWVQGCPRRCPGCMSAETWDPEGGELWETEALGAMIGREAKDGLTISGGEPFMQAPALAELILAARREKDLGVIIYTGFVYEELLERADAQPLLHAADLLIDGPFLEALQDGKALRGSSNQRAVMLTNRYADRIGEFGTGPTRIEFFSHADTTRMVGVPAPGMLGRMKNVNW